MTKYRSRQDIFDTAVLGLIAQGSPALEPDPYDESTKYACLYRGDKDTRCGIGFLIADEDYTDRMEHQSVTTCYAIGDAARIALPDRSFGQEVQNIHDHTVTALRNDPKLTFFEAIYQRVEEFLTDNPKIDGTAVRNALAEKWA